MGGYRVKKREFDSEKWAHASGTHQKNTVVDTTTAPGSNVSTSLILRVNSDLQGAPALEGNRHYLEKGRVDVAAGQGGCQVRDHAAQQQTSEPGTGGACGGDFTWQCRLPRPSPRAERRVVFPRVLGAVLGAPARQRAG